ncbi:MAG TPA: membrane protein insertase YidC [Gammaproteobacteria bacterium]|nr:membrane protein insertase YidC [Gammaproteobacteria bacterium]HRA43127.1 membrane protein insertase YidC [Gammaproteobacteria bacterium]
MTTQNIRFLLFALIVLIGMLLYNAWKQESVTIPIISHNKSGTQFENQARMDDKEIPEVGQGKSVLEQAPFVSQTYSLDREIQIKTDVLNVKIDKLGGDITQLILTTYAEDENNFGQGFVLFDNSDKRYYVAQSGLTGEQGPDKRGVGRAKYETHQASYQLEDNQTDLIVDLKTTAGTAVDVIKRFVFHRGSYIVDVEYLIYNKGKEDYKGSFYARLKRKAGKDTSGGFLGVQTFTGAAIHTPETPYKKISFKDIADKPLEESVQGGWAAMVEHYFVSAWVPSSGVTSQYQTNSLEHDIYSVGFVESVLTVGRGEEKSIKAQLYAGPEITEDLGKLAPGLELAVDYGILWPICQPIFWLLKKAFQLTSNWGLAIILTTIIIKALFYKLSASSYRSMGNMRKLQPKLEALKQRFGDDKQKYSQGMMELYKKEKINPLGGCLPVLVQIPVFIALYYVLLGSVELREAPFYFWITDLSGKDPYYVLPILMGLSMLVQQKLNPAPPDPVQAKVMMLMPVVFTVLFLNFPSGLVLYWFVNNVLSIAQQWFITRRIELSLRHGTK